MDQNQNLIFGQAGAAPVGDAFTTRFVVTAPPPPPVTIITTPTDITGLVKLLFGPMKKVRKFRDAQGRLHRGNFFMQQASIFNITDKLLAGPFTLVLDNLSRRVKLVNRTGVTITQAPLGSQYVQSSFNANTLASLQGGSFTLIYSNPRRRKITFTPRL